MALTDRPLPGTGSWSCCSLRCAFPVPPFGAGSVTCPALTVLGGFVGGVGGVWIGRQWF
jgi:hypothetical protein